MSKPDHSHFQTSIPGETPDEFPSSLIEDFEETRTVEFRAKKYENWKKATIIDKLAHTEKELEDNEIAYKAMLQAKADKISRLEQELHDLREALGVQEQDHQAQVKVWVKSFERKEEVHWQPQHTWPFGSISEMPVQESPRTVFNPTLMGIDLAVGPHKH